MPSPSMSAEQIKMLGAERVAGTRAPGKASGEARYYGDEWLRREHFAASWHRSKTKGRHSSHQEGKPAREKTRGGFATSQIRKAGTRLRIFCAIRLIRLPGIRFPANGVRLVPSGLPVPGS